VGGKRAFGGGGGQKYTKYNKINNNSNNFRGQDCCQGCEAPLALLICGPANHASDLQRDIYSFRIA